MEASLFLNCVSAEAVQGDDVAEVCEFLVSSLSRVTGIPFAVYSEAPEIDYFAIRCVHAGNPELAICWDGCVSRSDYRDDGQYAYGAFLFLYAGRERLFPDGHAYRYLLFETDASGTTSWRDLGWQIDDYDEYADRKMEA